MIVVHVLRRPHLPHLVEVTLVAGLLAILITLLVAGAVGPGVQSASRLLPVSHRAPAASLHTSKWLANPLAPLSSRPSPSPWVSSSLPGPR
ncbi:MAG TPA: hypothetical protein VFN65_11435 [Solirubrobacteraceae bacterium]|nr:hypothetical protein [Solirubrobacteraceae bacterium]